MKSVILPSHFPFSLWSFSLLLPFSYFSHCKPDRSCKWLGQCEFFNLDSLFRLFLQFKLTFPPTLAAILPVWVKSFFLPIFPFLLCHYHHHHYQHYHLIPRPQWLKICLFPFYNIVLKKSKLQRPMNGFMLFAKKFRLELIQQHPGKDNRWEDFSPSQLLTNYKYKTQPQKKPSSIWTPIRAISVLLGEAWKSLAAEDRELYSGKAKV